MKKPLVCWITRDSVYSKSYRLWDAIPSLSTTKDTGKVGHAAGTWYGGNGLSSFCPILFERVTGFKLPRGRRVKVQIIVKKVK